jgi:hypothetical protein
MKKAQTTDTASPAVFTAVKITPFWRTMLKTEAAWFSYRNTARRHNPEHLDTNAKGGKFVTNITYVHKGIGKVIPVLFINSAPRHEGVLGCGGTAPRILDLCTRWR